MSSSILSKLDSLIESPDKFSKTQERVVIIHAIQESHKETSKVSEKVEENSKEIKAVRKSVKEIDDKLFGSKDGDGLIYSLDSSIKALNKMLTIFTWLAGVIFTVIISNIVGNWLDIPLLRNDVDLISDQEVRTIHIPSQE